MLNFLSRIDRYIANNMHEHSRYLLELEPIDRVARACDDRRDDEDAAQRRSGTGWTLPRK